MPDFETRLDVSHAAWLIWTADGLGLDDLGLEQTYQRRTRRTMPMSRAFPLRIGWTTRSCACAAKTWAIRNDFDRRPVSDLGFMRLRLLGLLRRLRARQTRLACATGVSGMDPMRKNWQPNAARVRAFGRHARGASAKIGDCTIFVHFGKHFAAHAHECVVHPILSGNAST